MNKRNNNGPSIDPCGTPDLIKDSYGRGLMLWLLSGPPGFTCWISFAPVFS